MQTAKSIIVSFSKSTDNDSCILLVGEKHPKNDVEVSNYFAAAEAQEVQNKLITEKKK